MTINIILHAGTEKTGTTSIQHYLFGNIQALAERGYLLPISLGHPCHFELTTCALHNEPGHPLRAMLNLTDQAAFEAFREKKLSNLKAEITSSNCHTVLISDEHIAGHLTQGARMDDYLALFRGIGKVSKVIVYLRRQDEFRLSLFSEAIKSGNLTSFDIDNPLVPFRTIPHRFNYTRLLSRLETVFGKDTLRPRLFRRDEFTGGDVISDFLQQLDLSPPLQTKQSAPSNPSLDSRILKPISEMLRYVVSDNDAQTLHIHRDLISRAETVFTGKSPKMRAAFHQAFLDQFTQMNEHIKQTYFPGRVEPIFKPIPLDSDDGDYYPENSLSVDEMLDELHQREQQGLTIRSA